MYDLSNFTLRDMLMSGGDIRTLALDVKSAFFPYTIDQVFSRRA